MQTSTQEQMERDRRMSSMAQPQRLPSISSFNAAPHDTVRDSGNWSMNSARTSNISEHGAAFAAPGNVQLPPIDHGRPSPPDGYSHSPIDSNFASSQTSLHAGHAYGHDESSLANPSPSNSRRSSFNNQLNNLTLTSPLGGTPSTSQVSLRDTLDNRGNAIAGQLARERGIHGNSPHPPFMQHNGHDDSHHAGNPFGNGGGSIRGPRMAPPIVSPPRSQYGQAAPHPNDKQPTKGHPWAFPEPDIEIGDARSSHDPRASATSIHSSAAGSTYSTNSGYPPSGVAAPFNGHMTSYPQMPMDQSMHHHGAPDRRTSWTGSEATPYSRTPELRVSHKLAERKRRKEMKELFDELREVLPAERGGKSSKWEVLTKAVDYVKEQGKSVNTLNERLGQKDAQLEQMRQQLEQMRQQYREDLNARDAENRRLREDLGRSDSLRRINPQAPNATNTGFWPPTNNGVISPAGSNNDDYHHSEANDPNAGSRMHGIET